MNARRPRILLWTDDPERGGVAHYNHALLLALAARGDAVVCVQSPSSSPLVAAQKEAGVEHVFLPYDSAAEFGRTVIDMDLPRAVLQRHRPDLVVFSDCCPVSNLAARQAALALRIPFVVVVGFAAAYLAKQFAPCLPLLARHHAAAREVVAVSEENLQLLRRFFGLRADRGRVIHYGRPEAFFEDVDSARRARLRAELGLPTDAVVALTSARLAKLKGHHHLLAALARLARSDRARELHLLWLGDGEQRPALEAEIARLGLGLEKRVHLLGRRWDAADWADAADFFCLPTDYEGMPLAIMEAMAKGLPVIATAVSGIPEELGDTGRLLPDPAGPGGAERLVAELTEALADWTADAALRRRLGEAARDRARAMFRESRMLAQTLAVLDAALATPPAHPPASAANPAPAASRSAPQPLASSR